MTELTLDLYRGTCDSLQSTLFPSDVDRDAWNAAVEQIKQVLDHTKGQMPPYYPIPDVVKHEVIKIENEVRPN